MDDEHNRPTSSALVTVVTGIGVGVFVVFTVMLLLLSSYKLFHRCTKARTFSPNYVRMYAACIGVDNLLLFVYVISGTFYFRH